MDGWVVGSGWIGGWRDEQMSGWMMDGGRWMGGWMHSK